MHSYATSKIRESRPEHLGCACSSKCSAALVSRIKCASDDLANRRRQPQPTAHRSHDGSFSTSRPCYYCDIHVNSDPEKMESVLHPQTNRPVPVPSPHPTPFGRLSVWELKMSNCFVTSRLSQRVGSRRNDKQNDKPDQTMERGQDGHAHYLCECF